MTNSRVTVIGLGRMGGAVAARLHRAGFQVTGFDFNAAACLQAQQVGIATAQTVADSVRTAQVIWLMVPAGDPVDAVIQEMLPHMQPGVVIIDGGNSKFTDSQRRYHELAARGIPFIDCGTSGGVHGKEHGFSLMVGGGKEVYDQLVPLFQALAAPQGYGYVGSAGAGHYVKMVHNGIEYALLQAYAQGLQIIKEGSFKDEHIDLHEVVRIWNHGAVIRSWLLELTQEILKKDAGLDTVSGAIYESGTGEWTVQEAQKHTIPATLIEDSLRIRAESRRTGGNYATKLVAMLRNAFGGHAVDKTS